MKLLKNSTNPHLSFLIFHRTRTSRIAWCLVKKEISIMDPAGFQAMLQTQEQILVEAQRKTGQKATNKASRQQLQVRFAQKVSDTVNALRNPIFDLMISLIQETTT